MTALASSLLFVGVGCAKSDVAISPTAANDQSALQPMSADQFRANAQQFKESQDAAARAPAPQQQMMPSQHEGIDTSAEEAPAAPPSMKHERPTSFPGVLPPDRIHGKQVTIHTNKGDITFDLYDDQAPKASSNFVALAESGYYDGLIWHRVVPGFVIQGGDPKGDGTGGPGYKFEDEKVTLDYDAGIVAMANAGPNTNGSQFFIMLEDNPTLPKLYTVFGRVTKGLDVVRKIAVGDKMTSVVVSKR